MLRLLKVTGVYLGAFMLLISMIAFLLPPVGTFGVARADIKDYRQYQQRLCKQLGDNQRRLIETGHAFNVALTEQDKSNAWHSFYLTLDKQQEVVDEYHMAMINQAVGGNLQWSNYQQVTAHDAYYSLCY